MKLNSEKLKQIDFVKLIKESFVFAWRKKYLWWFGLFVSLGNFIIFIPSKNPQKSPENEIAVLKDNLLLKESYTFFSAHPQLIVIGVSVLIFLCIIFFLLSTFARGALIKLINLELEEKKSNLKNGLIFGKKYFRKILALTLSAIFFLLIILIILTFPVVFLFLVKAYFTAFFLFVIALLIFFPLTFLVYFLIHLGCLYLVLGDLSLKAAIENAYALLQKNLAANLVMLCLILVTDIIFFVTILFLFLPLALALFLIGLLLVFLFKTLGFIIAIILAILTFFLLFLTLLAFYEVFRQTAWIKFFHAIAKPKSTEEVLEKILKPKPIPTTDAIEEI